MMSDDFEVAGENEREYFAFPYLFKPEHTCRKTICVWFFQCDCVKSRTHMAELVQDEHSWLKSIFIFLENDRWFR